MDILDGKTFYQEWFQFVPTEPLNDNYAMMDIEDKNFMYNSGSYFILIAIIVAFNIGQEILNKIATLMPKFKWCRRMGMLVYAENWKKDISDEVSKLFLESYFDIAMCALLALLAFTEKNEHGEYEFFSFFGSGSDISCSLLSILHMFLIIYYPIKSYRLLINSFASFKIKKDATAFKKEYKTLLEENRHITTA